LQAPWPDQFGVQDVLAAITTPKRANYSGAYGSFLTSSFAAPLAGDNLASVLDWAAGQRSTWVGLDPVDPFGDDGPDAPGRKQSGRGSGQRGGRGDTHPPGSCLPAQLLIPKREIYPTPIAVPGPPRRK
jgi:hypothetical protein